MKTVSIFENTEINFCGESYKLSRPKDYDKLLQIIQSKFLFNPVDFHKLDIFCYLDELQEIKCTITPKNYNEISNSTTFLSIILEVRDDNDEEGQNFEEIEEFGQPVIDENAKKEIMQKIIEDTKLRIQSCNSEIITQSGLMEPSITNDLEKFINQKFDNLLQDMVKSSQVTLSKIEKLDSQKKEKEEELVEHFEYCNGCNCKTIKGIRYKCVICPSFNYCEKCESKIDEDKNLFHPHPFYKLKYPIKNFV